jgi:hypothetical protein
LGEVGVGGRDGRETTECEGKAIHFLTLLNHLLREQVKRFGRKGWGYARYYEMHVTRPCWGSWELCGPSQSCGPQKKVIERPAHYYSINQYQRQSIICLFTKYVQKLPRKGSSGAEVKAFLSRTTLAGYRETCWI